MEPSSNQIYINPKFKSAHINPSFLNYLNVQNALPHYVAKPKIHINPKFLNRQQPETPAIQVAVVETPQPIQAIFQTSKRKLIRVPIVDPQVKLYNNQQQEIVTPSTSLIKISNNKLISASQLMANQHKENELIKKTTESIINSKKDQRNREAAQSIYRLDRRPSANKKKKIITKYCIRPSDDSPPKRKDVYRPKVNGLSINSRNKTLSNIVRNGVTYKATSNKLQKLLSTSMESSERLVIFRGQKLIIDSSGTKLRHDNVNNKNPNKFSRFDFGGLTYKPSSSGAFEIDNSHKVRSHLSGAKTKSISLLTKSAMKKTNIICAIYRRLGKCSANDKGRCQNLHDARYIMMCKKFLLGSCSDVTCSLSHEANLHKMPVCKYFLKGLCLKEKCLYLHKKLNDSTKLCADFVKGYCSKADKCDLLHDYQISEQREKGKKYLFVKKAVKEIKEKIVKKIPTTSDKSRYFIEDVTEADLDGENVPKKRNLGSLPSFIPL
ncbi:unnamed protein product [Diamesa hyperborea]